MDEEDKTKEGFVEYLQGKKLGEETQKSYLRYYDLFEKGLDNNELNQSFVYRFIIEHPSNVTKSFLNNLFKFMKITDLEIPKTSGRKSKKKRRSISKKERSLISNWILDHKNIRYYFCFELSYCCALRRSEVLSIIKKDFDFDRWKENPEKHCRLLIHGKGNRERYVLVPPTLTAHLKEYMENEGKKDMDKLFPFSRTKWQKAFKDAIKETTDYNYTLHDLRRSRATDWLKSGVDLSRVKNRLGHASVSTTQLYINLDEEKELELWENE